MEKPRIVILSAFLSPLRSGAEACAEEVPLQLKDEFDFTIVTARMRKDTPKHDVLQGKIPVVRIGLGFGFGLGINKWLFPFLAPFVVRKLKPDLIHAVLETFAGLALVFCKWIVPGVPRMLTCQTTNRSFLKKWIVRSPNKVTVISTYLLSLIHTMGRSDASLIPNGIDVHTFENARDTYKKISDRVLFVGRLEKMKGVDDVLRAFAQVADKAHLHIVGDGSQRKALEALASTLGIANKVTFKGYISHDQIYKEYAEASIFLALSKSEALGNVLIEAQAAGCAVLSPIIQGTKDILADEVFASWPITDVQSASNALSALLENQEQWRHLSEAGIRNAQQYDWKNIANRYAEIYEKVL